VETAGPGPLPKNSGRKVAIQQLSPRPCDRWDLTELPPLAGRCFRWPTRFRLRHHFLDDATNTGIASGLPATSCSSCCSRGSQELPMALYLCIRQRPLAICPGLLRPGGHPGCPVAHEPRCGEAWAGPALQHRWLRASAATGSHQRLSGAKGRPRPAVPARGPGPGPQMGAHPNEDLAPTAGAATRPSNRANTWPLFAWLPN